MPPLFLISASPAQAQAWLASTYCSVSSRSGTVPLARSFSLSPPLAGDRSARSSRSGRFSSVARSASRSPPAPIAAWSPESSTSRHRRAPRPPAAGCSAGSRAGPPGSCRCSTDSASPTTPGTWRDSASISTMAGQLAPRQHVVADRDLLVHHRRRDPLVDPLVAPAQQDQVVRGRPARAPWRRPAAGPAARAVSAMGAAAPLASARAPRAIQGGAVITIPPPPPYGSSSTLRWRSSVKSRRSWTSTSRMPLLDRPAHQAGAQERPEQLGEDRQDRMRMLRATLPAGPPRSGPPRDVHVLEEALDERHRHLAALSVQPTSSKPPPSSTSSSPRPGPRPVRHGSGSRAARTGSRSPRRLRHLASGRPRARRRAAPRRRRGPRPRRSGRGAPDCGRGPCGRDDAHPERRRPCLPGAVRRAAPGRSAGHVAQDLDHHLAAHAVGAQHAADRLVGGQRPRAQLVEDFELIAHAPPVSPRVPSRVRSARAVRPCRPITLPMSAAATRSFEHRASPLGTS